MSATSTHKKLNAWYATAICGNDITSSCLYVSAITIAAAGQYAWLALLMVAGILFLFRKIYGEVVGALPLNGGAYNVLLNTTSKANASLAAVLTILSYMATAVLSASEAMHYLHHVLPYFNVNIATLGLLFLFLMLTIAGISESAVVALVIFLFHLVTLAILIFSCFYFISQHGLSQLSSNFSMPLQQGSILKALFFGFSAAMLGISGFESSANFVEEQAPGVFPKTLKYMWLAVTIINPTIAFLAIAVMPMSDATAYQSSFLSHMGSVTGGKLLATLISINAVTVLSGAVLTSFVGVNGLVKRMTLDKILPQFFLRENRRGSTYRILIAFFLLCASILLVTQGQIGPLSAVYTISFLLVMVFFALGNILLKIRRAKLPRPEYAQPLAVLVALLALVAALYGNIKKQPVYLVTFIQYFVPSMLFIYAMLNRKEILRFLFGTLTRSSYKHHEMAKEGARVLRQEIFDISKQEFVYFSKGDSIAQLNKVMRYLMDNEDTRKIRIVTILGDKDKGAHDKFRADFEVLDRAYPQVDMEYIEIPGEFTPALIEQLSNEWNIPKNFMFISSPSNRFSYRVAELGGVRLVM